MRVLGVLLILVALTCPSSAAASNLPRLMAHYTHQRWSEESDPPLPIFAVTQSPDGFLWVGASTSVYRFDGVKFEAIGVSDRGDRHGSPMAMLTTRAGEVWAYYSGSERFAIYRGGAMRLLDGPAPGGMVTSLTEDRTGAVWAGMGETGRGMLRYLNGRWTRFGAAEGLPQDQLLGTVAAADGSVWAAYINSLVRLPPGGSRFETVRRNPAGHGRIAADDQGRIWLYDGDGIRPITGPWGQGRPPPLRNAYRPRDNEPRGRMIFDPEGNLWISTKTSGLRRIGRPDPRGAETAALAVSEVESFTTRDGLTSDSVRQVYIDHEGDVWAPTEGGLDKFRPASIRVEPRLTDRAGYGDILLRGRQGEVYIAQASTIYRVAGGERPQPILAGQPEPEALCEAPDGSIWIVNSRGIVIWKDGRAVAGPAKLETPSGYYGCGFDAGGGVWAAGGEAGLLRLESGRWFPTDVADGSAEMMVADMAGRLVVALGPDLIRWWSPTFHDEQRIDYGGGRRELRTIEPLPGGDLLAAGAFGLKRFSPGGTPLTIDTGRLEVRGVRGLARTADGDTWLAGQTEIVRFRRGILERAFSDPGYKPARLSLSFADGLPARVATDAWRSMVQGGDGRLWIATLAGTVSVDPAALSHADRPPKLAIGALQAGEAMHRDPRAIQLPAGAGDVRIAYSLLSFADPRSVQFRYRLIGHNKGWVDPGQRREAFYTNLSPGRYRFEVIGANAGGVWNTTGAAVDFEIAPMFWQTTWFLLLVLSVVAAVLWVLYRLRLAQASAAIHSRLEERVQERERIARELHDTLLQSVQGLVLRFQAAADRLPRSTPTRQGLEAALTRADAILSESRDTLHDLRDTTATGDLVESMRDLAARLGVEGIPISFEATGEPRSVAPAVRAEILRIAREALLNAQRHASAGRIDLLVDQGSHALRVIVRDDGSGFPDAVIEQGGKKDHFGLIGMRERAQRIGGELAIANRPEDGAEVVLRLPWKVTTFRAWWRFGRGGCSGKDGSP